MAINTSSLTQHNINTVELVAQSQVSEAHQIKENSQNRSAKFLQMLPTLLINAVVPYAVNMVAQHYMPTIDSLLLASSVPALYTLGMFVWKKQVNAIGLLVVASLLLTAVFALLFRSPRLLLLQGSAVNGLFGVVMLVSLLFSRPILFYIIRSIVAQNDPQRAASFNANWAFPQVRHCYRLLTLIWGCVTVGQLLLVTVLVFNLPISGFAVIMPAAHWSMAMMRKNHRLVAQLREERDAAQQ